MNQLVDWIIARKNLVVKERNMRFEIFSPYEMKGLSIYGDGVNIKDVPEENVISDDGDSIVLNMAKGEKINLL